MKKYLRILAAAALTMLAISCGQKAMTITMNDEDCQYKVSVMSERNGIFFDVAPGTYYIKDEGDRLTLDMDVIITKETDFTASTPLILTLTLGNGGKVLRANDRIVEFQSTDIDAGFKALCEAGVGERVGLSFALAEGELDAVRSSIDADTKIHEVLLSTEDEGYEEPEIHEAIGFGVEVTEEDGVRHYKGKVGDAGVRVSLKENDGALFGRYRYDSQYEKGNNGSMILLGKAEGSDIALFESTDGQSTIGTFVGTVAVPYISGTYTRLKDGKEFPFEFELISIDDARAAGGFFAPEELEE